MHEHARCKLSVRQCVQHEIIRGERHFIGQLVFAKQLSFIFPRLSRQRNQLQINIVMLELGDRIQINDLRIKRLCRQHIEPRLEPEIAVNHIEFVQVLTKAMRTNLKALIDPRNRRQIHLLVHRRVQIHNDIVSIHNMVQLADNIQQRLLQLLLLYQQLCGKPVADKDDNISAIAILPADVHKLMHLDMVQAHFATPIPIPFVPHGQRLLHFLPAPLPLLLLFPNHLRFLFVLHHALNGRPQIAVNIVRFVVDSVLADELDAFVVSLLHLCS
mmetsp:Transcript_69575/g.110511  ORF Transcript_69575/g.110511 Transcript_69575/m.110511 type:complete len:272 (+) Transcript_69575:189-1004(+)